MLAATSLFDSISPEAAVPKREETRSRPNTFVYTPDLSGPGALCWRGPGLFIWGISNWRLRWGHFLSNLTTYGNVSLFLANLWRISRNVYKYNDFRQLSGIPANSMDASTKDYNFCWNFSLTFVNSGEFNALIIRELLRTTAHSKCGAVQKRVNLVDIETRCKMNLHV